MSTMAMGALALAGCVMVGSANQGAEGDGRADARAVECGLVAPDFRAPLRIFSPEYYLSQKTACLQDRMPSTRCRANATAGEAVMLEILASIAHAYAWPELARGGGV